MWNKIRRILWSEYRYQRARFLRWLAVFPPGSDPIVHAGCPRCRRTFESDLRFSIIVAYASDGNGVVCDDCGDILDAERGVI